MTAALVTLVAAAAQRAAAAEFSGGTTTIVRAFQVRHDLEGLPAARTYRPIDQHAQFSWTGIRSGSRRAWDVALQLRARTDVAGDKTGATDRLDVLFAHATWRSRSGGVRLRLGRQPTVSALGWRSHDGVRVDLRAGPRGSAFAFLGLPVDLWGSGAPRGADRTFGAGGSLHLPRHGSLGVEYEVQSRGGVRTEETAGFSLWLRRGPTTVSALAAYSLLLDRFGETTAVLRRAIGHRHAVEARFTRYEPIFPADTIWAVFASNPFDERRLSYEFQADSGWRLGGFVGHEDYTDTDFPGLQDISRAALTFSVPGRREGRHRGEVGWQEGFSGRRLAVRFDSDLALSPGWRAGGGFSVHRYENAYRLAELDEIVAVRGRVHHDRGGRFDVALEVERFFGRGRDTVRASLILATRFGRARHARPWWGGRFGDGWAPPLAGPGGAAAAEDDGGPAQGDEPE